MKLFYIAYFLFIHPFKFESYLNSKYVGQYPFHWISSITLPRQHKIVSFWQHLSSWEYLWWKGNFSWRVACLPNFFTNQSHQSKHKKHGGTEEHSCTVLVCICWMVPWGTLSTMEAGKRDNSQAKKLLLHIFFVFLVCCWGFLLFVSFFSFEKVLSEYTSHPWFGLQPSLQAPYKSDLAAHCSPAPSSRAWDLGTLSGERPKTGWPHARASKPLLPTVDEWGALVTSLADCALCILGFNVESKTGPIRGFTLPDKRGKKIKLKRKKVFGVRKMTLATPAFSSFAGWSSEDSNLQLHNQFCSLSSAAASTSSCFPYLLYYLGAV